MGLIAKIIMACFGIFWPPRSDAAPPVVFRWRLAIAGGVFFMAAGLTTTIALAWGFLPWAFSGFALASDVSEMKHQWEGIRADGLRAQIVAAVKDQCEARNKPYGAAAENYARERKDQLLDELAHVGDGKEPVRIPECWEVP